MMRLPVVSSFIVIFAAVTLTSGFTVPPPQLRPVITARASRSAPTWAAATSSNPNEPVATTITSSDDEDDSSTVTTTSSTDTTTSTTNTNLPLIVVNGHNIDLTSSLVDYIQKRIGNILSKLAKNGAVRECDVVLSVSRNPKVKNGHKVEIVTNVKGTTIICKNESPDMYTSIDAGAHALQRKLVQYKERRTDGWHGGGSTSSITGGTNDDDEFTLALEETIQSNVKLLNDVTEPERTEESPTEVDDDPSRKVVKIHSFQLDKSIALDEAIFALDYVDHDFYVFRNAETNEINVIYKRHHGGIGLIEP